MRHSLSSGRRVRIEASELDGLWEDDRGLISFRSSLRGRRLFTTIVHELLHAELPEMSERNVERVSDSIGRLIAQISRMARQKSQK